MFAQTSPNDYQKVKEILADALELDPDERAEFLQSVCAGNEKLRGEIESLMAESEHGGEFLENFSVARVIHESVSKDERFIGKSIGRYNIEKEIGRGGMGVVFLAIREDFHQQVALKIIKRGMDSDAIIERFAREREILAALDNPFIARLLDGGTTADGLPYFVMEYVEGISVDEYCRTKNLTEKEKLELFRKICEAVRFAHQKLIVHRDLKPSNILVTEDGTPKLLDFGIAKLLNSDVQETQTNQRVLTPAYASPEQLRGEAVDTRSDVYSLGKILAKILLGEKSENVKFTTANNGFSNFTKNIFNSDLKNILAAATREEASRRYNSSEAFSEDIRRYLTGLPVKARKDTFSYRTSKFVKRNRLAVSLSAFFLTLLLLSLAFTFYEYRKAESERTIAERERLRAEKRFDDLRKISDSFVGEISGAIENIPGNLPARRIILNRAVEQLDALAAESNDNPALEDELAQAYFHWSDLPDMPLTKKDEILKKEIEIYRHLLISDQQNLDYVQKIATAEIRLSDISKVRGKLPEATGYIDEAIIFLQKTLEDNPQNAARQTALGEAYFQNAGYWLLQNDFRRAQSIVENSAAAFEAARKIDPYTPELEEYISNLNYFRGIIDLQKGDLTAAIKNFQARIADKEKLAATKPDDTSLKYFLWTTRKRLAEAFEKKGDLPNAEKNILISLSIIEKLLAQSPQDFGYHRNAAITHIQYGKLLVRRKKNSQALKQFQIAADLCAPIIEKDSDNAESKAAFAAAESNLGELLIASGQAENGIKLLNKAKEIFDSIDAAESANAQTLDDYNQTIFRLAAAKNQRSDFQR